MESLVVTVIGKDRPGLVESVSAVVEQHGGSWVESDDSIEIILLHRETLEAGDFSTVHENEEIFRMTRDGSAMRGVWDVEDMYYSEDGLVVEGRRVNQPEVFARPR